MNIFAIARAVVLLAAVIMCCIGTAGPQWKSENSNIFADTKFEVYLYQAKVIYVGALSGKSTESWKYEKPDRGCTKDYDMWMAAYAFCIISCVVLGLTVIASVAGIFMKQVPGVAVTGLCGVAVVTLVIGWAISEYKRTNEFLCENAREWTQGKSAADFDFKIDYGLALLITAWCLTIVGAALGLVPQGSK